MKLAAEHFEAAEQDLVFEDGSVHVNGLLQAISLAQLAKQAESRKGGAGPVIATSNSIQENAPAVAVHAVRWPWIQKLERCRRKTTLPFRMWALQSTRC